MVAGFDYLTTSSGTTEFTGADDQRMVAWMDALASYLDHLLSAQEPRGRAAVWVRRAETPAIVGGSQVD